MTRQIALPGESVLGPDVTVGPDGQLRVSGLMTRAEFQAAEAIRMSRYFLVRNDGGEMGERQPCKRSKSAFDRGHIHAHFTLMCVERPFRGIEEGLRAWFRVASPGMRKSVLLAGMESGLQDYATRHPFTARQLQPTEPDTLKWYAVLAGTLEPISRETAARYAQHIKDRNPPLFPYELVELLQPLRTITVGRT